MRGASSLALGICGVKHKLERLDLLGRGGDWQIARINSLRP